MSEKFTPGPWKANFEDYTKPYVEILNGDNLVIAQIPDGEIIRGDKTILGLENIEANIDLIADAWQLPDLRREIKELKAINKEMYEAFKEAVFFVCDSCLEFERFKELFYGRRQKVVIAENPCPNCTNKVIKALRKARGETE